MIAATIREEAEKCHVPAPHGGKTVGTPSIHLVALPISCSKPKIACKSDQASGSDRAPERTCRGKVKIIIYGIWSSHVF